ncbi:MAG: hypothetical protein K2Y71_04520 [Xanthobacteraceae bacterium]|nr:hypothetical protein [Xanthobacteraceae bacterium]
MRPELLFLRRCEKMDSLSKSNNEADVLDLAAYLRQFILDGHSLIDTVNKSHIKIRFHVGCATYPIDDPHEAQTFWTIVDGLDPEIRRPGAPSAHLTRDQFLKHVVINNFGKKITIKDIIEHTANAAGGVHHDPKPRNTPTANASRTVLVHGLPIDTFYLKPIAIIVLRAVQPIVEDVQKRDGY